MVNKASVNGKEAEFYNELTAHTQPIDEANFKHV
jgi:hypothetical protein